MPGTLEKVTAFVTRRTNTGIELLLIRHPHAGIQIPAGTLEPGETPEAGVMREAAEETGVTALRVNRSLGTKLYPLPEDQRALLAETRVYSRPDPHSSTWAFLRRGQYVSLLGRADAGFTQISFIEWDRYPDPQYISMQITGWVPEAVLADKLLRHFFLLVFEGDCPAEWSVRSDGHLFSPFWCPLDSLPEIVPPQDEWLSLMHLPDNGLRDP